MLSFALCRMKNGKWKMYLIGCCIFCCSETYDTTAGCGTDVGWGAAVDCVAGTICAGMGVCSGIDWGAIDVKGGCIIGWFIICDGSIVV